VEGTHEWTQAVKDLLTIAFIMTVFLLAFATAAVVRCRTQRRQSAIAYAIQRKGSVA
jgi:hypothetical protein